MDSLGQKEKVLKNRKRKLEDGEKMPEEKKVLRKNIKLKRQKPKKEESGPVGRMKEKGRMQRC